VKYRTSDYNITTTFLEHNPPRQLTDTMVLTQDQIQVAQGALYLIDHIGPAPPGMDFRQFTDQAITDHLKQHTYHYRPRIPTGPDNRSLVTLAWMRRWIRDLSAKAKASFYQAESNGDDNADKLFRKGTTEGFPENLLRRYGYDRATFRRLIFLGT
jgi:hypothetical protein